VRLDDSATTSVEGASLRVLARRAFLTTIAAALVLAAAVIALIVPVFSRGIDVTATIVLFLLLDIPVLPYVARLSLLRGGSLRAANVSAVVALPLSLAFAVIMLWFAVANINSVQPFCPGCIGIGIKPVPATVTATSSLFRVSALLYLVSGIVGLVGIGWDDVKL
jgi:hypothetical protein